MIVETANSTYTFSGDKVKRTNHTGNKLRRDEEEVKLISMLPPKVGESMQMYIQIRDDDVQTLRVTSAVLSIHA